MVWRQTWALKPYASGTRAQELLSTKYVRFGYGTKMLVRSYEDHPNKGSSLEGWPSGDELATANKHNDHVKQ